MYGKVYNTVFVDGCGFMEIDDAKQAWLEERKNNMKEHEFLAKTGFAEDPRKPVMANGSNTFRNFIDI